MGDDPGKSLSEEERLAEEAKAALRESLERAHEMVSDAKLIAAGARRPRSARRNRLAEPNVPAPGSAPKR